MLVIWNHNACYLPYVGRDNKSKQSFQFDLLDKLRNLSLTRHENVHFMLYTSEYNHNVRKLQLCRDVDTIYSSRRKMNHTITKKLYCFSDTTYVNIYHTIMIIDYICNPNIIKKITCNYHVITVTRRTFLSSKLIDCNYHLHSYRWQNICGMSVSPSSDIIVNDTQIITAPSLIILPEYNAQTPVIDDYLQTQLCTMSKVDFPQTLVYYSNGMLMVYHIYAQSIFVLYDMNIYSIPYNAESELLPTTTYIESCTYQDSVSYVEPLKSERHFNSTGKPKCKFYLRGTCNRGNSCRYVHD